MPIEGIEQPEILLLENGLRLQKYFGPYIIKTQLNYQSSISVLFKNVFFSTK